MAHVKVDTFFFFSQTSGGPGGLVLLSPHRLKMLHKENDGNGAHPCLPSLNIL